VRLLLREEIQRIADGREMDPRVVLCVIAYRLVNPAELFAMMRDLELGPATDIGRALFRAQERLVLENATEIRSRVENALGRGALTEAVAILDASVDSLLTAIGAAQLHSNKWVSGSASDLSTDLGKLLQENVVPALREALAVGWKQMISSGKMTPEALRQVEDAAQAMAAARRPAQKLGYGSMIDRDANAVLDRLEADVAKQLGRREPGEQPTPSDRGLLASSSRLIEKLDSPARAYAFVLNHSGLKAGSIN
jgi:hypothetical protein